MSKSSNAYITWITLVATLGGLLFGYDTAVISGAIDYLSVFFDLSSTQKGFAVAIILLGCTLGAATAGAITLKFGRKKVLLFAALLFLAASLLSYTPTMYWHLLIARFLGGLGVGIASMISPMYIAELAPASLRGRLVSFNQLAIVGGILLAQLVNFLINAAHPVMEVTEFTSVEEFNAAFAQSWHVLTGWRYMLLAMAVPSVLFFGFLFFIPESPRWLSLQGRNEEALEVLKKINPLPVAERILSEIKENLANDANTPRAKLSGWGLVILIGCLLSVFQQITGINVILYYTQTVLKSMGSSTSSAFFETVIVGAINVLFTLVAIFTVDRFGRKPLLIIGAIGMAIGMIALGTVAYQLDLGAAAVKGIAITNPNAAALGTAALISILVYIASFAMSWGPVVWVLISEIFPNVIRGKAMAIAVACQWIFNFLIAQTFPMMSESETLLSSFKGGFPFWLYGAMGFVAVWFVWKMVPETKGKTLEEMENNWVMH